MPDADFEHLQDVVRHRYDLEELVGRGGMGAVYRARHVSLDAPVAIKVLPVPASLGEDELARFRREAMLAARLPHPHIVPVYEFEIRGDLAYLVMPLVDGVSLAERLRQDGPLPLPEVRRLVEQIGGALGFAHARGIIHRDVKPANILWEPANSRWLITDFGIARHVEVEGDAITSVGGVLGTPAYMAPEQAAGLELDGRTDMYSLAATACEALTGQRLKPLAGRDTAVHAMLAAPTPVPPKVAALLALPLAASPDDRPPTMESWLTQITGPRHRPWWRRTGVMLAAAVATTLAGITWLLTTTPSPPSDPAAVIAVVPFADETSLGLSRSLAQAFEDELRWLPEIQVVPAAAVEEVVGTLDLASPAGLDSAAHLVLARFGAGIRMLSGTITDDGTDHLRLSVQLRHADGITTTVADQRGVPDSLAALVARAVLRLFGPAEGGAAYRPSLPGGGLEAMGALRAGDSLFRAAAYDAAIARYDRVLALDSTYALAAFKRMFAEVLRTQPTRASRAVRSALEPVRRYRGNLDPMNLALLEAYEVLVADGDVEGAHQRVRDLTDRYPLAVDAWFVRGYLEFYFGPLFGTPSTLARWSLGKAEALDPGFAAVRGLLGWIALLEGDDEIARTHLRAYLAIDSTSTWAAVARLGDSLRLRGGRVAMGTLRRVEDRPAGALELFALAGAALQLQPAERLLVGDAARALRDRATTAEERAIAFRLQLGNALGSGRSATVDTLFREARRRNVPLDELDRAMVLLAVTGLWHRAIPESDVIEAARRLTAAADDPTSQWLAARWLHDRDRGRAQQARQALRRVANEGAGEALLARSLLGDLEALDQLSAGDTLAAFARWASATKHFQFEEVPFGLVASLWPLRLGWARTAAARGDHNEVVLATATFEVSPGFMDQVARPIALPLRADALDATGDRLAARELRRRYAEVLRDATEPWAALRDTLLARSGGS